MKEKVFLTSKEAAEYLGLKMGGLYDLTKNKKIPFHKPNGKRLLFRRDELDAWVVHSVTDKMEGGV